MTRREARPRVFAPITTWAEEGIHAPPVHVHGPCRGGMVHVWSRRGPHLSCSRCGWVPCCGVRRHLFHQDWLPPCPTKALDDHAWEAHGPHWRCSGCSLVPCCTANRRARKLGEHKAEVVAALRERDGDRCFYCGAGLDDESLGKTSTLTVDHRLCRKDGGRNDLPNLVLACAYCNAGKGDRTVEEWEASGSLHVRRVWVLKAVLAAEGLHWRGGYVHSGTFERRGDRWRCPTCGVSAEGPRLFDVPCKPCSPTV